MCRYEYLCHNVSGKVYLEYHPSSYQPEVPLGLGFRLGLMT